MKRSAPEVGYDDGFKPMQRKQAWRLLLDGKQNKPSLNWLAMPSAEGTEIEWVKTKGLRLANLHCVDRNPAIVAHLSRRFHGINTYGVDIAKAADRIVKKGVCIDAANLDLTGPATDALLAKLNHMAGIRLWAHRARVSVTVLRGREQRDRIGTVMRAQAAAQAHAEFYIKRDGLSEFDLSRIAVLSAGLTGMVSASELGWPVTPYAAHLIHADTYRSTAGTQSMLWAVFELYRWNEMEPLLAKWKQLGPIVRQLGEPSRRVASECAELAAAFDRSFTAHLVSHGVSA